MIKETKMEELDETLFIQICSKDAREQFTRQTLPILQSLLDLYGFRVIEYLSHCLK